MIIWHSSNLTIWQFDNSLAISPLQAQPSPSSQTPSGADRDSGLVWRKYKIQMQCSVCLYYRLQRPQIWLHTSSFSLFSHLSRGNLSCKLLHGSSVDLAMKMTSFQKARNCILLGIPQPWKPQRRSPPALKQASSSFCFFFRFTSFWGHGGSEMLLFIWGALSYLASVLGDMTFSHT